MITVSILINGQPIYTRSAYRIEGRENEECKYHCDNGKTITHNYNDGAVKLAHKLLDTIQEKSIKEQRLEELAAIIKEKKL